jgi:sugar lactone lactonase YvrE
MHMKKIVTGLLLIMILLQACDDTVVRKQTVAQVSTLAGGSSGDVDGSGVDARLNAPGSIVVAQDGTLFFTDGHNHKIKKVTTSGEVITIAGSIKGYADGPAATARFTYPYGIALTTDGTLYVTDSTSVRKITPDGMVNTLAGNNTIGDNDGQGSQARFNSPSGITIDFEHNLFVADMLNNRIRKITPEGMVTTFAGNTAGFRDDSRSRALFDHPAGIEFSTDTILYIADTKNHRIRKITPDGIVSTVSGDGKLYETNPDQAILMYPMDVTMLVSTEMFVPDMRGKVKHITKGGKISDVAGMNVSGYVDGAVDIAKFGSTMGLAIADDGSIYISDTANNAIRKISFE